MKKPDRYVFPALLTFDEGFDIAVTFPDLDGCATSGENELEACEMANEALGLHLWGMEQDGDEIPEPSKITDIKTENNQCIIMVDVFMPAVRTAMENRSVNRTVTLPAWLNSLGIEHKVNFSLLLQNALKNELNIKL